MAEGRGRSRSEFQPPPTASGVHESATPSVGHIKSKVQTTAGSLRPCPGFHGSGARELLPSWLSGIPSHQQTPPPVGRISQAPPPFSLQTGHHPSPTPEPSTSRTPPTWFQQPSAPPPRSRRCDALTPRGTRDASCVSDKTLKCRKPQGWPRVTLLDSEWLS